MEEDAGVVLVTVAQHISLNMIMGASNITFLILNRVESPLFRQSKVDLAAFYAWARCSADGYQQ